MAATLVVLAASLTACGADAGADPDDVETVIVTETAAAEPTDDMGGTPSMPTSAPTSEGPMAPYTGAVTPEELVEDLNGAVEITERFWEDHWTEFFTGTYTPPTVIGLYDGTDAASAPTCFDEPLPADNAFYCPDGDYVAWDQTLIARGFEVGDSWPYLVVAHEWGHAIQARLAMSLQADALELQADCLAGATLYGSAADGNLTFEDGDEKEIVNALNQLSDETAWTMSGDHGDSFQRIEAFNTGRSGGVVECLPRSKTKG
ncbi:neutral zinc metallopeptidase [Nocardioides sp. YIM 152588]|uniref:neutral zinc metallopeptidase n=1 Tax=Nocardioides sp. YIM 152588 TaxID=3158259 RepID=UPI0032E4ECBB